MHTTPTIYPVNQPVGGVRAVQGEHQGEHYYFRTKHYKGCSTRGNAENANDALCIFKGIANRFRGHLYPIWHTAVTCYSATAAATTYRTRRRVESHRREDMVYERGRAAVGGLRQ